MRTPIELPKHLEELDPTPTVPDGMVRQVREYRLITPLFGGGVEPGVADPVTLIRGTTIRGQLRFWWRATRGGASGPAAAAMQDEELLNDMKQREATIWGAASLPNQPAVSQVQVEIRLPPSPKHRPFNPIDRNGRTVAHIGMPQSRHSYAAFPLNQKKGVVQTNVVFELVLTYPAKYTDDIDDALWAWETFGGIGGRTRRGFGALAFVGSTDLPTMGAALDSIKKRIARITQGRYWHQAVPHLAADKWRLLVVRNETINDIARKHNIENWSRRLTIHNEDAGLAMWDFLIESLRSFRQDRNGQFGRSRWPEADAIRDITGQKAHYQEINGRLHDHRTPTVRLNNRPIFVFPRAVFGLPLIFQFKDGPDGLARDTRKYIDQGLTATPPRDPDPEAVTLQDKTFERWASPLILRPMQCSDGIVGLAYVLAQPQIDASKLELANAPATPIRTQLTEQEAKQIKVLDGQTDVLDAFLNYLEG